MIPVFHAEAEYNSGSDNENKRSKDHQKIYQILFPCAYNSALFIFGFIFSYAFKDGGDNFGYAIIGTYTVRR
jgi:hypothetical protein